MLFEVNTFTVLLAAILHFVIGLLWYSPILFGNLWIRLAHITPEALKHAGPTYFYGFLISLITALGMGIIITNIPIRTITDAITLGLVVSIGFIVTLLAGDILWEKKPVGLFLIRAVFNIVALSLVALVFVLV